MELGGCMTESEAVQKLLIRQRAAALENTEPTPVKVKALSSMNRAELDKVVAAEGIVLPAEAKTNQKIVEAIEASRAVGQESNEGAAAVPRESSDG